jgi:hypothetical protein
MGQLWTPGQSVRLVSVGDTVPPLDVTVAGPSPFSLIEPNLQAPVVVSRAAGLRVRWSGGTAAQLVAALVSNTASGRQLQVKCSFDAAAGEGMIPPEALTDLVAGAQTSFVAVGEGYQAQTIQGWLLRAAARTRSVSQSVTIQ